MPGPLSPDERLVLLPERMSPNAEALLDERFTVCRLYGNEATEAMLERYGAHIRVAVVGASAGFPEHLWDRLPALELIAVHGVGADRVDLERARQRGVAVLFSPPVLADDVADLAIGLWLALSRQILSADRYIRSGEWSAGRLFPLTRQATGQRAGILGLGRIGSAIARRLEGFGATIAYTARSPKSGCAYTYAPNVTALAGMSDVLFLAAPGGSATENMVGRRELDALGPSGLLINVARGSLVDEAEVIDALSTGRLGGAGLDVFGSEPVIDPRFLGLGNVILQPHLGSATVETRRLMARILVDQISACFSRIERPLLA